MKKTAIYLFLAALLGVAGSFAGCGGNTDASSAGGESASGGEGPSVYAKYSGVADKKEDAAYSFTDAALAESVALYPESRGGKTYYVAAAGKDSNSGLTENDPVTLNKISSLTLGAGDSVLLKKGDTFKGQLLLENISGADDNPVTVASYGTADAKPVLENGQDVRDVLVFNKCSNLVIRDLDINVKWKDRGDGDGGAATGIIGNYDYVGTNKYKNIYIINNTVRSTGTRSNVMGITVGSVESTFASCPSDVLTNVYIKNNLVYDVGRSGIHAHGWLANEKINQNNGLHTLFRNVFVDNNVVHDVGCIGLYVGCATNSTMNRNLVYNTGMYDVAEVMEGECGIMAISLDTCEIKFNESYNNYDSKLGYDAMAIDIDWNTKNCIVQYNHTYDCMGGGIGTMANVDCAILNNRVENNRTATNQYGQISVGDFTSRYAAVDESMHTVKNLRVEENLIVAAPTDFKGMFTAKKSNGDDNWSGNAYKDNHVVYTGEEKDFYWNYVDEAIPWYKFAGNKYYSSDLSVFKCFDYTEYAHIDYTDGAKPYEFDGKFPSWALRDVGATYEEYTPDGAPSAPAEAKAAYADGKLTLSWTASKGDLWHYNVFAVGEKEEVSYRKMLGETKTTSFTLTPESKGTFYYIVQPESNQGVLGEALKIKVTLS